MDEFLQGILQPDHVGELALTAFLLFVLVTSWLGTIRSTMALARRLGRTAREARVRLTEMSSTQVGVAVGLSTLLVAVLCGWLLGVLVIGNLTTLAYAQDGHRLLEPETQNAMSLRGEPDTRRRVRRVRRAARRNGPVATSAPRSVPTQQAPQARTA
ncbi:hypothetical protein [Streptomyces sp. NPDC006997]|uniref:hypothetical protein n=1 Tax=Streptomyces sp. NPDC006997 TaxID=3155356 RepID=UPI003407F38B